MEELNSRVERWLVYDRLEDLFIATYISAAFMLFSQDTLAALMLFLLAGGRGGVLHGEGGLGESSSGLAALSVLCPCGVRFLFEPASVNGTVDVEYLEGTAGRCTLAALTIFRPEAPPLAVKGERGGGDTRWAIATFLCREGGGETDLPPRWAVRILLCFSTSSLALIVCFICSVEV